MESKEKFVAQGEKEKSGNRNKLYKSPKLIVHGSIEKITLVKNQLGPDAFSSSTHS